MVPAPLLILAHVVAGIIGIVSGAVAVAGILAGRNLAAWNLAFLLATAFACLTGLAFLPTDGLNSAQIVNLFLGLLLLLAAYARYVRSLTGSWRAVYALAVVGALFVDVLIAAAQSFLHVRWLAALAPTQASPLFVAVKAVLLLSFTALAIAAARRAGSP